MITADQQKQIDGVMELLSDYITQPPWEEWMVEVFSEAVGYAAEMLELSEEEVLDYLDEQPLGQMAHAHVFEHFITTETNENDESVLHEFMRTRMEQSGASFTLDYLNALDAAELALWEVTGFKAGQYADGGAAYSGNCFLYTLDSSIHRSITDTCLDHFLAIDLELNRSRRRYSVT